VRRRRVLAVAIKELLQVWRDPRSLMLALLMPVIQMLLLGYGANLDVAHIPTCTLDQEDSQFSQSLLKRFQASRYFDIVSVLHTTGDIARAVDRGQCKLVVVVPVGFSRQLAGARRASVQMILDATDANTASLASGYARAVVGSFAADVQLEVVRRAGMAALPQTIAANSRVWFNEQLESRNFIIPGVVALVLALVGAQLTSLTISREWERGTMELLLSTPVTRMELMIGKLLPYFLIGLLDAAICLGFALLVFKVPFRGSFLTLLLAVSLFLAVVLSIGYLVSASIRSQIGASQIALLLTVMPISLLSGFAFPIDQMPAVIQGITYIVYARYFVTILKAVFLKGSGIAALWVPLLALALYAAVVTRLAARAFRKRLS
jgi:ABC-2 type transport system permease protein